MDGLILIEIKQHKTLNKTMGYNKRISRKAYHKVSLIDTLLIPEQIRVFETCYKNN